MYEEEGGDWFSIPVELITENIGEAVKDWEIEGDDKGLFFGVVLAFRSHVFNLSLPFFMEQPEALSPILMFAILGREITKEECKLFRINRLTQMPVILNVSRQEIKDDMDGLVRAIQI